MKRYTLLFCLLFQFGNCLYGEFIPLKQYNKKTAEIGQIPDHYLFAASGILAALNFQCGDEKETIKKFNKLPIEEQYHVAYLLSALKKDRRIREHFLPVYDTLRRRNKEPSFEETFGKKSEALWEIFITSLEKDSLKATDFYKYAIRISSVIGSKNTEDEELYIVSMLSLASHKKLINATQCDRIKIIKHIADVINKLTSNSAKTRLTYDFIHFMNAEQVADLNTTEYALLLSIPKVLYYGKFIEFFPIFMNVIEHTEPEDLKNMQIVDDLNYCFPGYNWTSAADAMSFMKSNIKNLRFDGKRKKYRIDKN